MTKERRSTVVINQSQLGHSESAALCGMFSVNNAVQERDLLTLAKMKPVLDELKITHPKQDHGSKTRGLYSILSLSHGLNRQGWHMVYLNDKLPYADMSKKKWFPRLAATAKINDDMADWENGEEVDEPTMITVTKRLVIIGFPPGQKEGVLHAIAMAKGKLIDPDCGTVLSASADQLQQWMERVTGVYAIMKNGEVAQFMEDQKRLVAKKEASLEAKKRRETKQRKPRPKPRRNRDVRYGLFG